MLTAGLLARGLLSGGIGVTKGLVGVVDGVVAASVSITGLTSGAAQIGTHASIGATMSDASPITAYKWGSTAGGTQYGTGAAPTDFTAGDGGSLYLTATTAAGDFTRTALIRYAAGTAPAIADGQAWTVDDTSVSIDASASGANLTWSYVLSGSTAGVTINSGSGLISGTPTGVDSGTATVTATDQYGRTVSDTFTWTAALRTAATGGADLDLTFPEDSAIASTDLKANWTTNGNTLTYAITGTALPTGLSVSSAGLMTGTPTTVTADATYTLRGTDEYGRTTDDTFTLEITAVAALTTTRYMVAGAPTTDSLRVNIGTVAGAADVKLAYSTASNMAGHTATAAITTDNAILAATFDAPALTADTLYYYQAKIDGVLTGPIQSCRTLPSAAGNIKIAFASCADRNDTGLAVYGQIAAQSPHLMIGMGDTPYIDETTNDEQLFRTKMQNWLSLYGTPNLFGTVPYAYTWSDHDYGNNGSYDTNTASKPAVQAVYRQLQPHYPLEVAGSIYHAFDAGPVRVIVMDLHSERDTGILMSATQLTWVKAEMTAAEADANIKLIMLVSSAPWIGTVSDGWSYASAQRTEIGDHALSLGIQNRTLLIHGDAHMLAYDDGTNNVHNTSGTASFRVACSSPLNRANSTKGGPYTTGPFATSNKQFTTMNAVHNGGELDITLTGYSDGTQTYQATFTTADDAAPVLTSPTDAANGSTAATASVSTNKGNGTLYTVITTSATPPSAAQVKLGQNHTGAAAAYATSQAISSTGVKNTTPAPSGLTASTAYWAHFMHENSSGGQSTVASGDGFTTDAAVTFTVVRRQEVKVRSTTASITRASSPPSGSLEVLFAAVDKSPSGFSTPTGFTLIDSHNGTGEIGGAFFYRITDGTETGNVTLSWTGTENCHMVLTEISGTFGGSPLLASGAVKTEAQAINVALTASPSVTPVPAFGIAFYANDSHSTAVGNATATNGYTTTIISSNFGGYPSVIRGTRTISATGTETVTLGHDGSNDGSIGFIAVFGG